MEQNKWEITIEASASVVDSNGNPVNNKQEDNS